MFMGPVLVPLTHWLTPLCAVWWLKRPPSGSVSSYSRRCLMGRPLISRLPLVGLCVVFPGVSNEEQSWAVSWGWGMRKTWPSQRQRVAYGWSPILYTSKFFWAVLHSRWRLASIHWGNVEGIWSGRLRVFSDATNLFQHSGPYQRTLRTLPLKILIFAWMLSPVDLHMDFNMAKAWLALLILVWCAFVSLQLWWLCFPGMWIPQRPLVVCYLPVLNCSWWWSSVGPDSLLICLRWNWGALSSAGCLGVSGLEAKVISMIQVL